jgi:chromosome segregation ATPase
MGPIFHYMKTLSKWTILLFVPLLCTSGCKSTYYSAYEKLGVYKRDLLKKRVIAARDSEKDAQQEFKDALTRLKEISNFEGGELEKRYRQLQSDFDDADRRVQAVHKRVEAVEAVASDLFTEWEKENQEITTPSLRATSRSQLAETRRRYQEMLAALKKAESTMDPVLHKLRDYVLALKHSLNAQAIAALKGEALNIQSEITRLLDDMNVSISHADEFIKGLSE